jgi:hypothetical protein
LTNVHFPISTICSFHFPMISNLCHFLKIYVIYLISKILFIIFLRSIILIFTWLHMLQAGARATTEQSYTYILNFKIRKFFKIYFRILIILKIIFNYFFWKNLFAKFKVLPHWPPSHRYDWNFMPDGRDVPGHGFWASTGVPQSFTLVPHSVLFI